MSTWSAALTRHMEARVTPAPQFPLPRRRKKGRPYRITPAARTLNDDEVGRMTERQAHTLLCRLRWPQTAGGPICPACGCVECGIISTRRTFKCKGCKYQFTVTTGTLWHGHKLPLRRILKFIFYFVIASKGVSATSITGQMDFDHKTSLIMGHKVREAIANSHGSLQLSGDIEIDGIYFGGARRRPNLGRGTPPSYGSRSPRRCVLTLAQRDGPVIAIPVEGETKAAILTAVRAHVRRGSTIITDELAAYDFLSAYFELKRVNHSVEFANGSISTNNAESFHARLRRSQQGVYHRFSAGRDLDLYVQELAFRHSHRQVDTRTLWEKVIFLTLHHPQSERFAGYWQGRG